MDISDNESISVLLNNQPLDDFEGYSAAEMHHILYDLFSNDCPVKIHASITEEVLRQMPFLLQTKYMLDRINEKKEIMLTAQRYLPVWLVKDIYAQRILKDEGIEKGFVKLNREAASFTVFLTNTLARMAGLTKVRNNHMLLTRKGNKLLDDWYGLFMEIFRTFSVTYAWSQNDGYEDYDSCQRGFGFTLKLLFKYGAQEHEVDFYGDKFQIAFPRILDLIEPSHYRSLQEVFTSCYSLRTFERFLIYFNLVSIHYEGTFYFNRKMYLQKTDIFDKVFNIE